MVRPGARPARGSRWPTKSARQDRVPLTASKPPVASDHLARLVARAVRDPGFALPVGQMDRHKRRSKIVAADVLALGGVREELRTGDASGAQIPTKGTRKIVSRRATTHRVNEEQLGWLSMRPSSIFSPRRNGHASPREKAIRRAGVTCHRWSQTIGRVTAMRIAFRTRRCGSSPRSIIAYTLIGKKLVDRYAHRVALGVLPDTVVIPSPTDTEHLPEYSETSNATKDEK